MTTEINIKVAKALEDLKELNAPATGVPEIVANYNAAIQSMADKTGLSLGAVETKFKTVSAEAERLQRGIRLSMPGVNMAGIDLGNDYQNALLKAGQPFGELGSAAGFKAAADARKESVTFANQEAKSEAAIAKELNMQVESKRKSAALSDKLAKQEDARLTKLERMSAAEEAKQYNAVVEAKRKAAAIDANPPSSSRR